MADSIRVDRAAEASQDPGRERKVAGPVPFQPPAEHDHGVRLLNSGDPGTTIRRAWRRPESNARRQGSRRERSRVRPVRRPPPSLTALSPPSSPHDLDAVGGPASKRVLRSQGRRTMRRLLDAAMIAFDQRGYYDTRINDVGGDRKDVARHLLPLLLQQRGPVASASSPKAGGPCAHSGQRARTAPPEMGGTPQWSDVRGWIALYSDLWIRYAPLFRAWTDLATIDPSLLEILRQTLTTMSDALERQIGLGAADRSIDPNTAGMAVMAMLDRFHYMRGVRGPTGRRGGARHPGHHDPPVRSSNVRYSRLRTPGDPRLSRLSLPAEPRRPVRRRRPCPTRGASAHRPRRCSDR